VPLKTMHTYQKIDLKEVIIIGGVVGDSLEFIASAFG